MSAKKYSITTLVSLALPLIYIAIDYGLRMTNGDVHSGGMSDALNMYCFYVFMLIIALNFGYIAFQKSKILALVLFLVSAWCAFWYVGMASLLYVCNAGIDCI
ncbi:MAG: hypothetical protein ABJG88_01985 [Litorimonas sp.]